MANLLLSAFADEYSRDFEAQLKYLHDNGIAYIEPRFIDGKNIADLTLSETKEVKRRLDFYGIGVSSVGSPLGKIHLADDFSAHLEKTKKVCEQANLLGTENLRVFSFYLREGQTADACRGEVLEKLQKMLQVAEAAGVTLCHENEAKIYGESPDACLEILAHFGGKMKCVFDMGNFVLGGYKPFPDAYGKLKNYIKYLHIKDALYAGAVVPPACGEASVPEILRACAADFPGDMFITLEPHLQTFDGLNSLAGRSFDNPYKFQSAEMAFSVAVAKIKELL